MPKGINTLARHSTWGFITAEEHLDGVSTTDPALLLPGSVDSTIGTTSCPQTLVYLRHRGTSGTCLGNDEDPTPGSLSPLGNAAVGREQYFLGISQVKHRKDISF